MSLLAIIAIVLGVLIVVFFIGGLIVVRRRTRANDGALREHITAADRALEAARAADRGWDVVRLEEAARRALEREEGPVFSKIIVIRKVAFVGCPSDPIVGAKRHL